MSVQEVSEYPTGHMCYIVLSLYKHQDVPFSFLTLPLLTLSPSHLHCISALHITLLFSYTHSNIYMTSTFSSPRRPFQPVFSCLGQDAIFTSTFRPSGDVSQGKSRMSADIHGTHTYVGLRRRKPTIAIQSPILESSTASRSPTRISDRLVPCS